MAHGILLTYGMAAPYSLATPREEYMANGFCTRP